MAASRFKFEREVLRPGMRRIAGADEAGRGPLAGPVVAAVASFPLEWVRDGLPRRFHGLNDSKQLSEAEREKYFQRIMEQPEISWAAAVIDADAIDSLNILRASLKAMEEAMLQLDPLPDHVLVDGPYIFSVRCPQTPLIQGDAKSFSIAAASVIAKVTRDRLMRQYDEHYPEYGFAEHKGYCTAKHLQALARLGPCPIHRRSFAPIRQQEPELF